MLCSNWLYCPYLQVFFILFCMANKGQYMNITLDSTLWCILNPLSIIEADNKNWLLCQYACKNKAKYFLWIVWAEKSHWSFKM